MYLAQSLLISLILMYGIAVKLTSASPPLRNSVETLTLACLNKINVPC